MQAHFGAEQRLTRTEMAPFSENPPLSGYICFSLRSAIARSQRVSGIDHLALLSKYINDRAFEKCQPNQPR